MQHKTVLLHEAVDALNLKADSVVVDATFGAGGHGREIVKRLGDGGTYIGIDADANALHEELLGPTKAEVHLINNNFGHIDDILCSLNIEKVDAVLADLGWRMDQFVGGGKGFSFSHNEPLLMTYGDSRGYPFTAYDIVNDWDEKVIADVIFGYAEERFARRIAKAIVEKRRESPISTTADLVAVIDSALPSFAKRGRIHPATKTFQALRIAVNDEFAVLEKFIKQAFVHLNSGGKFAVITFHSGEDRVVKHAFRELKNSGQALLTPKKPIAPKFEETKENPRARSAKLRVITKS